MSACVPRGRAFTTMHIVFMQIYYRCLRPFRMIHSYCLHIAVIASYPTPGLLCCQYAYADSITGLFQLLLYFCYGPGGIKTRHPDRGGDDPVPTFGIKSQSQSLTAYSLTCYNHGINQGRIVYDNQ